MSQATETAAFAIEVAQYLDGWEFDSASYAEREKRVQLITPELDGAGIHFGIVWNKKDRMQISGEFPPKMIVENRPSITVSRDRDAQSVAKDIERRFIGQYVERYLKVVEQQYIAALRQQQAADFADELAAILGTEVRQEQDRYKVGCSQATFEVCAGRDAPYIRLAHIYSVTPAIAKGIAKVFKDGG